MHKMYIIQFLNLQKFIKKRKRLLKADIQATVKKMNCQKGRCCKIWKPWHSQVPQLGVLRSFCKLLSCSRFLGRPLYSQWWSLLTTNRSAYVQQGRKMPERVQNDFQLNVIKIVSGTERGQLSIILKIQPPEQLHLPRTKQSHTAV